jgi:hypothetical protein
MRICVYTSGMSPMQVGDQWTIEVGVITYAMTEDRTHAITVNVQ